ncbi:MAG: hypothetical protein HC880_11495 [Bacteroidia bacterium]|nr:hypothetical protein [Bacteroidia bacterium]
MKIFIKIIFTWLLLCMALTAEAQEYILSGIVKTKNNDATLPGVNILVEGTNIGTTTDIDGAFNLKLFQAQQVRLVVSFLGYKTQILSVNPTDPASSQNLSISLEEDAFGLDQIVVTGQGIDVERRRLSTNVTVVGEKQLEKLPFQRLDALIRSEVPTLQVNLNSGQPGTSSLMRARGITSATFNSTPIIMWMAYE